MTQPLPPHLAAAPAGRRHGSRPLLLLACALGIGLGRPVPGRAAAADPAPDEAPASALPAAVLALGAHAGWGDAGGDLLAIVGDGPLVAFTLQTRLGGRTYLRLEHLRTAPDILPEAEVQESLDQIRCNRDYRYWDLTLLAGVDLGAPRLRRPRAFLEAGAGLGSETFTWTTTDLEGGSVLERSPDRYVFVLAVGGGARIAVLPSLSCELAACWRVHWDTDPGSGFFDVTSGTFYPPEDFEPSTTLQGSLLCGRLGVVWSVF